MANHNGDNYKKVYVDKPSVQVEKGEVAGRKRLLFESMTTANAIANGDVILGPKIPANSLVIDAGIRVSKSLGATGIMTLGHAASDGGTDVADADAFVGGVTADAGGQAVLVGPAAGAAGIGKRFSEETQMILTFVEEVDDTVADAEINFWVEYVND